MTFVKYRMIFTITSLAVNAPALVTIPRGSTCRFEAILNDDAIDEDVVWSIAVPGYAIVNSDGSVTALNKTGTAPLTATDPVSGLSSSIVLRII
jgi:hypothetical protein